jgi:hypothetical protein
LEKQTAYITDAGMTGPLDSVIGLNKKEALDRFHTRIPHRFMEVAKGEGIMSAVLVEADKETGRARGITRLASKFTVTTEAPHQHHYQKK